MITPKQFFKRWLHGMKTLSPDRQLKGHIAGAKGNIIGFTGGIITMGYMVFSTKQYYWWWTIFILIIALFTTILDLIGKQQQLVAMATMTESLKTLEGVQLQK